ncbi:hypothetical protein BGZ94_001381 [Podila epigama]|nr:hypothetical protein BGZ94_001381 [Podila epigama]
MFSKRLTLVVAILALSIPYVAAHMALLYPKPRGGIGTKEYDGEVHAWIGFNKKRVLPCNGYGPGPVTTLTAGKVVNVRFWGPALQKEYLNRVPDKPGKHLREINQARHGGGTCEFSLSADGGRTFHLIGRYTRSCPDFYYEWPVKIPSNVPSCTTPGKCLFVWSWTAVNVPQFYQNCADVVIHGKKSGGKWPSKGVRIVDVKGYPQNVVAKGDGYDDKIGKGPIPSEVNTNLKGTWN